MKKLFFLSIIIFVSFTIFAQQDKIISKSIVIKKEQEKIEETRDIKVLEEYSDSKRWAIIVGINNYEDKYIFDLNKAQNDAKGVADVLKHEGQFDYVFTYTDDTDKQGEFYPSLNNIVAKFEQMQHEVKPNDTFVFFFSGHGISDNSKRTYLLTADTVISQSYKTSLPLYEVQNYLSKMKVKKNIVFLDACRNVVEKTKSINIKTLLNEINSQAEISAVMYSTSEGEFSYEHDEEPYGVFSAFIINGLKGEADYNNDVMITFNELRKYVEEGVKDWSIKKNKKQKPYTSIRGEFHSDVILSIIPLKERAKYNPLSIKNSYKKQLFLYQGLFAGSLSVMITGFTGSVIGLSLGLAGYNQYYNLTPDSNLDDFNLYWYMKDAGIWSAVGCGILTLAAIAPFVVSFAIKPKKSKIQYSLNVNYNNDNLVLFVSLSL